MPLLAFALCGLLTAPPPADAALERETAAWHQDRKQRLLADDGWLSLVGLHWLEEGGQFDGFKREGKTVRFTPAAGAPVQLNGQPFAGGPLKSDATAKPDVIQRGSVRFLVIERGQRIGIRVKDSQAPARKAFTDIARYPATARWKVEARFVAAKEPRSVPVPTVLGTIEPMPSPGQLFFTVDGKQFELTPVTEDDDSLFIIFGDQTNRDETYGSGRFLSTDLPKNGKVVLDFNRAYNPPCAFSAFATCPLPPPGNRLALKVLAGEKRYGAH